MNHRRKIVEMTCFIREENNSNNGNEKKKIDTRNTCTCKKKYLHFYSRVYNKLCLRFHNIQFFSDHNENAVK